MSFHTVTMLIRWILTAKDDDFKQISFLKSLTYRERCKNNEVKILVSKLKETWGSGTKIEKIAVFNWNDNEVEKIFCDILENYDSLKTQFDAHASIYGSPSEITDNNFDLYMQSSANEMKNF